jgi:hypothetical protein
MDVSLTTIGLAGLAAWIAGAVWYGVLGNAWVAALGTTKAALMGPSGRPSPLPFILSFVADLVVAAAIAWMAPRVGGAFVAALIGWAGFVLTTVATNNAYAKRTPMLTAIDAGHWLVAMLVAAAVIAVLG